MCPDLGGGFAAVVAIMAITAAAALIAWLDAPLGQADDVSLAKSPKIISKGWIPEAKNENEISCGSNLKKRKAPRVDATWLKEWGHTVI